MLSFSTLENFPDKNPINTLSSDDNTLKKTKLNIAIKLKINFY